MGTDRFDARTRAWAEMTLGEPLVRVRRLHGGVSSIIHRLDTATGRFVVRRVPRMATDPGDVPADDIRREARALTAMAGTPGVPELVIADPDGAACGVPACIQTWLPGRPVTGPRHLGSWVDGLADAIRSVATAEVDTQSFERFTPWFKPHSSAPPGLADPRPWDEALAAVRVAEPPGGPDGLVHRDLHPGNVLFHRGRCSGVVDWANACRGPVQLDVARVRVEVALVAGIEAADAVLAACGDLPGGYDPMWDAFVALELGPWVDGLLMLNTFGSRLTVPGIVATLDHLVRQAVS